MAKKNRIADNVSAVNAENIETVSNLSQEETNKNETQPATGTEETDTPVQNSSQGIDGVSPLQNSENVESPESNFMLFDKEEVEKGKDAFKPTVKELGDTYPNKAKTTKRKESHIEKLKRERAAKKKAKADFHNNEKAAFNAANPNDTFEGYKYDNTAYNPRGEELIGKEGLDKREQRLADRAAQKVETNQQLFEKGMEFFNQHEKYNQFGGSFNYDQFTSSMTPEVIRASSKALGVKGLSNVGIATPELYNAMKKAYDEKKGVALSQRAALVAEKKAAEDRLLADKENAEANADKLQVIKDWRATLSNDPKVFTRGQAEALQKILKDEFGQNITIDDIMAQQTTGTLIDVMLNELHIPKDYLIASGLMLPKGYEDATALDTFLDGSDEEQAAYALRFAQRRDQRNRFNQSLVDLAGITSRMIAASGGAKMEPYKNDMYDKFREDMKAARQRYDARMGEIRQREIDAEKEAYARIREREKAAQEQANLDRAYNLQASRAEAQDKYNEERLALERAELQWRKDFNNAKADSEKIEALLEGQRAGQLSLNEERLLFTALVNARKQEGASMTYEEMDELSKNFSLAFRKTLPFYEGEEKESPQQSTYAPYAPYQFWNPQPQSGGTGGGYNGPVRPQEEIVDNQGKSRL